MLIRVLTFTIFAKQLIISQCAPKLGPVFFDPVKLDISDPMIELPPRIAAVMLRSENKPQEEPGRPCQGYNFDENNCKLVNNRILCGYNKNVGEIANKEIVVDMGNGCHMKGDRIECGYKTRPFEGIRRPSVQVDPKEAMRYSRARTPTDRIMMKLKAVSLTATPTERNSQITKLRAVLSLSDTTSSKVSNEDSNETGTNTIKGISETEIVKDSNLTMTTSLIIRNDSSLPTVIPTSTTNNTTNIPSIDSSTLLNVLENMITTKTKENVESEISTEKTDNEFTLSIGEDTTDFSSKTKETTGKKIKIKRRNSSQDKPRQALCVEKKDRIVCYDDHFLPKKCG